MRESLSRAGSWSCGGEITKGREATSGGPRSSYGKMHELWDNMSCVGLAVLDMPRSPTPQKS